MNIVGIDGKTVIKMMLKATDKVCKKHELPKQKRTVAKMLVFEITNEFLETLSNAEEKKAPEISDTLDDFFEDITELLEEEDEDDE